MKELVELTNALNLTSMLTQNLIECGGEITPELESYILHLELNSAKAVEQTNVVLSRLELEEQYFKQLADQYYTAAQSIKSFQQRLRDEIKRNMQMNGLSTLEGQSVKFKLSPAQPKTIIDDIDQLPMQYKAQVITIEPDKEKIREDLKEGLTVPGARLEQSFSLRTYVNKGKII